MNTWPERWVLPLKNSILGGSIYIYIHLPSFIEGKIISWSIPPYIFLVFDNTHMLFIHRVFGHGQPAELHVCVLGLHGVSLLGWQSSFVIFYSPRHCNHIREKFLQRQRYVPALSWLILNHWRKKNSGLGGSVCSKVSLCRGIWNSN